MAKVSIDIDMDRFAQAREIFGTETISDTIDAALREVIRRAVGQNEELLAEGFGK